MSEAINPEFMPPSGQDYQQILYGLDNVEEAYTLRRGETAKTILGEIGDVREAIKNVLLKKLISLWLIVMNLKSR